MSLNIGILTSTDVRHRYFVNAIAERHTVVAVGYQDTGYEPADAAAQSVDAQEPHMWRGVFRGGSPSSARQYVVPVRQKNMVTVAIRAPWYALLGGP